MTLAGLALGGIALKRQATANRLASETVSPPTIEPDTSDLTSTLASGAVAALATAGVIKIVSEIASRRAREQQRYDNFQALKEIALGIGDMQAEDLNGVPDAEFLPLFENAVGVPNKTSLSFSPSWERGAKSVALALADRRNKWNAPETGGGRLPPDPRVSGTGILADARRLARQVVVAAYYRDKQFRREGLM
jgi:hypothetical protein